MLTSKYLISSTVTSPVRPSVARKAKASGTPAKLEATPENVISAERTERGRPPHDRGISEEEADDRAAERRGQR